jgi:hypothetical protein
MASGRNNSRLMQDHIDEDKALGEALCDAEYASLTSRAVTDNSRALVDDVLRLITEAETRKRRRVSRAEAFRQAVEGFIGDLLGAIGRGGNAGWVYRAMGRRHFKDDVVSYRDFTALRKMMKTLALLEEFWSGFEAEQEMKRWATRFRATPRLEQLAAQHGIQPAEINRHFKHSLPDHPLRLKATSTRATKGDKTGGEVMEIDYTEEVKALEQVIRDLNTFLDKFTIGGGTHRGYFRLFHCGDHPKFNWNVGGRLYSVGGGYQRLSGAARLKMTIDGKPVCDLDIKSSSLTIFHALRGQPLDVASGLDPYQTGELSATPRDVVKQFITATFGQGQFPARWPKEATDEQEEKTGQSLGKQYPISRVRGAVARAYPLLAELRQDDAQPPVWATLNYLESEAVLRTMLTLKDLEVPSLSVHDGILVPRDSEALAKVTLEEHYHAATTAIPYIVVSRW